MSKIIFLFLTSFTLKKKKREKKRIFMQTAKENLMPVIQLHLFKLRLFLPLSLPKANLTKPRQHLNPELSNEI